jgi:glycosyltransferase involved in cell wall biosynthesis
LNVAFEALASLLQQDRSYRLVIIGDGPEKHALQTRVNALDVNDAVYWRGQIYDQAELAPWFLSALAFVYPGAIGLSLLHAFAYGLPVITHSSVEFQAPEFAALKNGVNGLTFSHGDATDLARVIHLLGENPEYAQEFGANALETIHNDYSLAGMVERFVQAVSCASAIARGRSKKSPYAQTGNIRIW